MAATQGLYSKLMYLAVQGKRITNGTFSQSKFTRYIESIQYLSEDELIQLQNIELSKIMNHAVNNIPYYKNLLGKLELSPSSARDDIKHFPIITKDIYNTKKEQFVDPNILVIKSMYSGGTTFTKVSVNTGIYFETHKANEFFNRMVGIYPGMSRFIISRHEDTYIEGGPVYKDIDFQANKISRTYQVTPFDFNAEKLKRAYELYIKAKPQIFKGNTSTLVEFAESIEKNDWKIHKVPIVFSGQTNMKKEYVETLHRVFDSKVYNAYGATESGIVAAQCDEGKGLHYVPILHYLETLKNGKQVENGKPGSLIITSLAHYAMPIIRYQIGDFATLTDKKCDCGRNFPMIEKLDGRTYETINTPVGSLVTVYEFKNIFEKFPTVSDFQ
ncbi:MAG: phenylacetate--CoA ligase family protein, partial [Clostridiales bacterium]|nr:phenylacetate--CoA ligase family protein [Clostridiales bacterium]